MQNETKWLYLHQCNRKSAMVPVVFLVNATAHVALQFLMVANGGHHTHGVMADMASIFAHQPNNPQSDPFNDPVTRYPNPCAHNYFK